MLPVHHRPAGRSLGRNLLPVPGVHADRAGQVGRQGAVYKQREWKASCPPSPLTCLPQRQSVPCSAVPSSARTSGPGCRARGHWASGRQSVGRAEHRAWRPEKRPRSPASPGPGSCCAGCRLCDPNESLTSLTIHRGKWNLVMGGVRLQPSQVPGADGGPGRRRDQAVSALTPIPATRAPSHQPLWEDRELGLCLQGGGARAVINASTM